MGCIGSIQNLTEMVESIGIADRDEDISGTGSDQAIVKLRIVEDAELFQRFLVAGLFPFGVSLGQGKNPEEHGAEDHARNGGVLLGQEVGDGNQEQEGRDQSEPERYLMLADYQVARDLPFAMLWILIAKNGDGEPVEGETPDDAEGVESGQEVEVAAAHHDGENLQQGDQVNGAVSSSIFLVRALKPGCQDAGLAKPVQHAVGAEDCGVRGA